MTVLPGTRRVVVALCPQPLYQFSGFEWESCVEADLVEMDRACEVGICEVKV